MTKDYVDAVVRMFVKKSKAKKFLMKRLIEQRIENRITAQNYEEIKEYIKLK